MIDLAYAFTAGAVATVNPCGFALLPVWLAQRLGTETDRAGRLMRALAHGALATLGCLAVFAAAGGVLGAGAAWLGPALPVAGLVLGILLSLGAALRLAAPGRLPAHPRFCALPGARRGSLIFGAAYGVMSLSCTLPIFLAAVGVSLAGGPAGMAVNLTAYATGMGTVLTVLAVLAAFGRAGAGRLGAGRLARRAGAVLALAAGLYVSLYWGTVVFGGPVPTGAVLSLGERASGMLRAVLSAPTARTALAVAAAALAVSGLASLLRRRA